MLAENIAYRNGIIRFEGSYRINHAYGPNFPEYGSWYDENGKLKYRGLIRISRSSLGWPMVVEPKGFSWERRFQPEGHMFGWNVAEKYIKQAAPDAYDIAQEETIQDILDEEKAEECTEETKKDRKCSSGFQTFGINEVFTDNADFSPASVCPLKLKSILHKAYIEVNQEGTKAAAATMAEAALGCCMPRKTKKVVLDRPFIFSVMDREAGIPLFTGVVRHLEDAKENPERLKRRLERSKRLRNRD